ncbi:MAG: cyclodeaminase/cyclohydrolase family protein [bacterium]|nr:cyclodeaminase/cyclohydrolase family protein [bacterium]
MNSPSQNFPARLVHQPVLGFIELVASKAPAPGGGSVAALSGSLGVALLVMVINLTVGKKNYAAVSARFTELRGTLEDLRARLTVCIDDDTNAFNRLRAASKLPECDEIEKAAKDKEQAAASGEAVRVPESTMKLCLAALEHAPEIADEGNANCVSDAGTGAEMLLAGLEGAAANVLINLSGLPADAAQSLRQEVDTLRRHGRALLERTREIVGAKLGG